MKIHVTWVDSIDAESYLILYSLTPSLNDAVPGAFALQGDQGADLLGLAPLTLYYIWVVSISNTFIMGVPAGPVTATTLAAPTGQLNFPGIQNTIQAWALAVVAPPLTAAEVIWKNEDGPRPKKDFVALRITGPFKPGTTDDSSDALSLSGNRRFTVTVECFGQVYATVISRATKLQTALELPQFNQILEDGGIGVGEIRIVQDLTELLETKWENRAYFEFDIYAASNEPGDFGKIDTVPFVNNLP